MTMSLDFTSIDLPAYASDSLGRPDLTSIANRLKEMAVLLSEHGLTEAAEHLARGYGSVLAGLAARAEDGRGRA